MTRTAFEAWLRRYGAAWEAHDADAAAALFSADAEYYWTPFEQPKRGLAEIARAWSEATSTQRGVKFQFDILAVTAPIGIASWHAWFSREGTSGMVEVDGVLTAEFESSGLCHRFREWWHMREPAQASAGPVLSRDA